jgi:cell division transport system permease protein
LRWGYLGFIGRRVRNSLWELLWNHLLTTLTMAMTLFVFGAFILLQENLQSWLHGLGEQVQINAYLDNEVVEKDVHSLEERIRDFAEVATVRRISKAQAWADFSAALGAQSNVLEGLPADVLPASFEISIKPTYQDSRLVEDIADRIGRLTGISAVEYPHESVEKLSLVVLTVQWAKWLVGGVLFVATFFIVASTVRLALTARKEEIDIMQLVGASEELIQAPFVIEGLMQGLIGGAVAVLGLWGLYEFVVQHLLSHTLLFGPVTLRFLEGFSIARLLIIGCALGAMASLFSLRRFLRTWRG